MKLTVAVTRIYGTRDQYGSEPRLRPSGAPVVYADFPDAGATATIDFGPVPDDVAEAERVRRGLGALVLRGFLGDDPVAGTTPDERLETALGELAGEPRFDDRNWYATLVVSREIAVADEEVPTGFAFPRSAFALGEEARQRSKQALDVLTTLASTFVDVGIFSELVLDDRVHFFARDKRPAGVPVVTASAAAQLTRGDESVAELNDRIRTLEELDPHRATRSSWLSRTAHWRTQVLLERDVWKRFFWSFIALEVLTNKLYDELREGIVERLRLSDENELVADPLPFDEMLWAPIRAPLTAKFSVVATALFPETAKDDTATFRELKEARDQLSHGSLRVESEVPAARSMTLLQKYVDRAITVLVG